MKKDYLVSIIVPVFNEEVSIAPFMKELDRALEPIHDHLEIIFVNDGSRDNTVAEVNKVIAADRRVSLVNFPGTSARSLRFQQDSASLTAILPFRWT